MKPEKLYKGSLLMEVSVWLIALALYPFTIGFSLLVGFIYSIWRIADKPKVCCVCKSKEFVPVTSPIAMRILKERKAQQRSR